MKDSPVEQMTASAPTERSIGLFSSQKTKDESAGDWGVGDARPRRHARPQGRARPRGTYENRECLYRKVGIELRLAAYCDVSS